MNEGKIMESFDVVSLFTTTPVDKSLLIVKSKLQEDVTLNERTSLPIDTIKARSRSAFSFRLHLQVLLDWLRGANVAPPTPLSVNEAQAESLI
jgi:hypothetical protein